MNTLLATAVALFAALPLEGWGDRVVVHRRVNTMGTALWLELEVQERTEGLRASEEAIRSVVAAERRLSTWITESELARFLASPAGERVELTPLLAEELRTAARICEETSGAFDPSVGALTQAWGLRNGGRTPSDDERTAALKACGASLWKVDHNHALRKHPLLAIEEGGFGKGAALDQAIEALEREGVSDASLNLGGQLAFVGAKTRTVPIADPEERRAALLEIEVRGGSVATSGTTERGSHIIDPRSGLPAEDFGSVTVWAESALVADALATGLFVLGPKEGLAVAEQMSGVEAVIIKKSESGREVITTSGLCKRTRSLNRDATGKLTVSFSAQ